MIASKTHAIQKALQGNWQEAIQLNQEILKDSPDDTEALNRLAFAYSILGKIKEAKELYQKVLSIDSINSIALRGLKRLSSQTAKNKTASISLNNIFIEETGKTRVIELINIADSKTIMNLQIGEQLTLSIKRSKIFVTTLEKQYIGVLPDNIGNRLIKFMSGGNDYEAYVKSTGNNQISIFVREVKRANKFKNQPSFIFDKSQLQVKHAQKEHEGTKKSHSSDELESEADDESESL